MNLTESRLISLYLDQVQAAVSGAINAEQYALITDPEEILGEKKTEKLTAAGIKLIRDRQPEDRWIVNQVSMVGRKRLRHLRKCVEDILRREIPGDLIETGVWRGGASILMRAVLAAYGDEQRQVFAADSFAGLPEPDPERFPADGGDRHHTIEQLAISVDEVKGNFERFGLLDDQVTFLKGWFQDTLPTVKDRNWALIRLDGDMYESTIVALENLYPGLSPGGIVIIDDYGSIPACAEAVEDFRSRHGISEPLQEIDRAGRFWQREAPVPNPS